MNKTVFPTMEHNTNCRGHFLYLSELDFCKIPVWNIEFNELDFWSISNWNFAGYTGSKYQVQAGKKSTSSNSTFQTGILQKIKCR